MVRGCTKLFSEFIRVLTEVLGRPFCVRHRIEENAKRRVCFRSFVVFL
jgi:hypothetical protein